jgi:hypothetical protein
LLPHAGAARPKAGGGRSRFIRKKHPVLLIASIFQSAESARAIHFAIDPCLEVPSEFAWSYTAINPPIRPHEVEEFHLFLEKIA